MENRKYRADCIKMDAGPPDLLGETTLYDVSRRYLMLVEILTHLVNVRTFHPPLGSPLEGLFDQNVIEIVYCECNMVKNQSHSFRK